jgi:GAF domain-containing protein/HAMP domain-containing protein
MIDRFLRRLPVRRRIVGGFLILVLLSASSVPLIVTNQTFLLNRLQQITEFEARANRLLLLASSRVESSGVNLMRTTQDYAPSAYETLDDVDQATQLLTEARDLIPVPEQKVAVDMVLVTLEDYRNLVGDVEAARSEAEEQNVSRNLSQLYRLGNDIGQRIEQIVNDSEARVTTANEAIHAEARARLMLLGLVYVAMVLVSLLLAMLISRSITRPVAELRQGAEAFRQGRLEVTVSVLGMDELSLLAQTFNDMAAQLRELIATLEQRMAERTRDLERRAIQLSTAADVGRAVASILELESLTGAVVDLIRERFDLYYAGLFLLDGEGRYASLEAGTGEPGHLMKEQGHRLEVGGISMVGAACALGQARIAPDAGAEPVRFDNPLLPDTRSEMALPLMVGNRVLGALDVQSTVLAAFSEEDIAVLQLVADQVAVAIENARLFAEAEAVLGAERRIYGEMRREAWQEILWAQPELGYLSRRQGTVPSRDLWRPQMDAALRNGRPTLADKDPASLAIPLKLGDQVIGVVDGRKPEGTGGWTAEEIEVLESLTEQLNVALEGARLYQDTQRREARERLLSQTTARMRETLDIDTVLQTAIREIGEALGIAEVEVRMGREAVQESPQSTALGGNEGDDGSKGVPS